VISGGFQVTSIVVWLTADALTVGPANGDAGPDRWSAEGLVEFPVVVKTITCI
jgi:hypothetical protein